MQAEHGVRRMPQRRFNDGDPLIVVGVLGVIAWSVLVLCCGISL